MATACSTPTSSRSAPIPPIPTATHDGIPDGVEVGSAGAPIDTDGDGTIDALDPDDDGDGIPTSAEDANGNGNPADDDADGDGIPDYREPDADDDGVGDGTDNCPGVANASQSDVNADGIGDACQPGDIDADGWPDASDNCVVVANPLQDDANGDGIGDACTDTRSVARQWNEELLEAIRRDFARPTVHARNLFHVSAAMWDAWAAYDPQALQVLHVETRHGRRRARRARPGDQLRGLPDPARALRQLARRRVRADVVRRAHAAARLRQGIHGDGRRRRSARRARQPDRRDACWPSASRTDRTSQNGYANQHYQPVNPPLIVALPGNPELLDREPLAAARARLLHRPERQPDPGRLARRSCARSGAR